MPLLRTPHVLALLVAVSTTTPSDWAGSWIAAPKRTPSNGSVDGPLLGNGDWGVAVGASGDRLTYHLGKNDFFEFKAGDDHAVPVGGILSPVPNPRPYRLTIVLYCIVLFNDVL